MTLRLHLVMFSETSAITLFFAAMLMNARDSILSYSTGMSLRGHQQIPILWLSGPSGPLPRRQHLLEHNIKRQLPTALTHTSHARLPESHMLQPVVEPVQDIQNAQKILVRGQKDVQRHAQKLTEEVQKIATRMNKVFRKQDELSKWHHCQWRCKAVDDAHETDVSASTTQREQAAQSPVKMSISDPRTKRLVPPT